MNDTLMQYLETAIWSSCDENGDHFKADLSDFTPEAIEQAKKDLADFIEQAGDLLEDLDMTDVAHDLWLTRNHHGAGFWDRGLGDIGKKLTDIAHSFGELGLYKDDDSQVHFE